MGEQFAPARQVIWADRIDRTRKDIFEFHDEVTREIVNAIGPKLWSGYTPWAFFITVGIAEALVYLHRAVSHHC